MITLIVIALALGAIGLLLVAVRGRKKRATQTVRPIDLKAFRMLMDREDELFLKQRLPRRRFSKLKRQRIAVTMRYVGRIAGNASLVMGLGEAARGSSDPEVARTAAQILELASQLRLQCLLALGKLSLEFAVPSLQLTPAVLAPEYQKLRENVAHLGKLQAQNAALLPVAI
ncbi:MAG TPA: hypothetical protein VFY05_01520 [Candidatus Angelobacter sp.]|nr:hypothetical protein [Candidatus Angelobacter sp.]